MLVSENIGKRFFVLLSANKRLNRMNNSQILDFIAFYKVSQLFLIWGYTYMHTHTHTHTHIHIQYNGPQHFSLIMPFLIMHVEIRLILSAGWSFFQAAGFTLSLTLSFVPARGIGCSFCSCQRCEVISCCCSW